MGLYTDSQEGQWRAAAMAYLREQLGGAAPASVEGPLHVGMSPLEAEGQVAIYAFRADPSGRGEGRYFVAIGETAPNYYPDYCIDLDDVFSLHLGTRFMLVVGVGQAVAPAGEEDAAAAARSVVDAVAPGEPIEGATAAAAFDVEAERHLVIRCRVGGEDVYVMAGDAPPGFSRRVDLPPQVAYRLHIGRVLRQEAD